MSLHCNGVNSYLFLNGTEIYKFKAKDSEIVPTPLCLGNISNDWSTDNMKKQDLMVMSMIYVYVDYNVTDVNEVKDIHKYLMKENDIV